MTPFSTRKTWSGSLFRPCSFKNVSKFVRSRPLNNTTASPCGGISLFAFFRPKAIVVMTRAKLRQAKQHIVFSMQAPYANGDPKNHGERKRCSWPSTLFFAQRDHRIEPRRAMRRQETRRRRDGSQSDNSHKNRQRVVRFQTEEQGSCRARRGQRQRGANRDAYRQEQSCFAHDQSDYVSPLRPQCHANSDFIRPPCHRVGNHAVQSHRGEQRRQKTEKA